ncbi:unnamed protein product [Toxocara canis]|uniref:Apoptotic enhancer 1 protein n=1 Tax=Toxocara canis TaxID=6265 RepID=A0A183UJR7_TOXCA|nr:unnamed protein product [Toxocara canis]
MNFIFSEGNSYNDIVRMAEQQRLLIDANRREIEARESKPQRIDDAAARLAVLRNEVLREEREMARLNAIQREAREACAQRIAAEKRLYDLQNAFTSQEEQLRNAASRIDSLKTQLDLLYRRRLSAMNAARVQQKRLNAQNAQNRSLKNDEAPKSNAANESASRPRASVEPFQITRPTIVVTKEEKRHMGPTAVPPAPPPPSSQNLRAILSPSKDLTDRVVFRKPLRSEQQTRREESPSPPKDPYPSPLCALEKPTVLIQKSEAKISSSVPVARVTNVISANAAKASPITEPLLTPSSTLTTALAGSMVQQSRRGTNMHQLWNEAKILDEEAAMTTEGNENVPLREEDSGRITMADQISIRADTLRAAKRRSWAQQESSVDEAEYIRKILCEQQKKGRTHLNLDSHLESLLNHSPHSEVTNEKNEPADPVEVSAEVSEILPSTSSDACTKKESASMHPEASTDKSIESETVAENDASAEINTAAESLFSEISYESMKLIKPPPEKGILRPSGSKKSRGHIVFDPLALLLDAALEGEMDLVRASAAKMCNLSASNDEGITALHNAICAGHYEIVRFLVESFADVNAQDSDGWTPLHCAASCNNLPMVKLLVENGACVFAQTLSDLETPAEKCEEDEDGYEGCQQYLQAAHSNAGLLNDGKMYAAYSYEKMRDDELSFEKGECLKVLERDGDERAWWLCTRMAPEGVNAERGLVPRNYLSLYPCLSDRPVGFVPFELPIIGCMNIRPETNATKTDFDVNSDSNNVLKMEVLEQVLIKEQPPVLSVS